MGALACGSCQPIEDGVEVDSGSSRVRVGDESKVGEGADVKGPATSETS